MAGFDLERAIEDWKISLWKHPGLEPGYVEELEGNLRDRIDEYLEDGHPEKEAFNMALEKSSENPEVLANEYYKARSSSLKKPPWNRRTFLLPYLPTNFKIALRNLLKRKVYAVLNILGLATGISVSFLLWLYIEDQSSYDRHFPFADRIYRVCTEDDINNEKVIDSNAAFPVAATLKADYPEVLESTLIRRIDRVATLKNGKRFFATKDAFVTEPDFFGVFNIEFLHGDPTTALSHPFEVVISESYAKRLFDSTNVIGKIIQWSGELQPIDVKITGVMKDLDKHSHLPLEILLNSGTYFGDREKKAWNLHRAYTYIRLNELNDIEGLRNKMPEFNKKYLELLNTDPRTRTKTNGFIFQPLTSIYLDPEYNWEPYPHRSRINLEITKIGIIFLLLIACINYVNLSTALAAERAKEVGIRKTLGSSDYHLFIQFVSESITVSVAAGILALVLSIPLLPYFSEITLVKFDLETLFQFRNIVTLFALSVIIGMVAGLYPAIYLSSFLPNVAGKGMTSTRDRSEWLRKLLVTLQYVISSVLLIGILIVWSQTKYIKNKSMGFNKENLIQISVPDDEKSLKNVEPFINEIRNRTDIIGVSMGEYDLYSNRNELQYEVEAPNGQTVAIHTQIMTADDNFVNTIGAQIVKGRNFDRSLDDIQTFLVNETAVKQYGWQDNELGLRLKFNDFFGNPVEWKSVGVVSDFLIGVSYQRPRPMVIKFDKKLRPSNNLIIGIKNQRFRESLQELGSVWEERFVGYPFDFQFVEENFNALYEKEEKFLSVLGGLCFLIVFIASLGVVGLIAFTTELKRKEIAIRKVNGARLEEVVAFLSKQFVLLLIVANVIAIPIAFYLVQEWLNNYEQRIDLSIWPFVMALFICIAFTALALLYHTMLAARDNPIEALRYE